MHYVLVNEPWYIQLYIFFLIAIVVMEMANLGNQAELACDLKRLTKIRKKYEVLNLIRLTEEQSLKAFLAVRSLDEQLNKCLNIRKYL